MQQEYQSCDTSDFEKGLILACKYLNKSNIDTQNLLLQWGHSISRTTVGNIWNKYQNGNVSSMRTNYGRKKVFSEEQTNMIINAAKQDRLLSAADLQNNPLLNPGGHCIGTIETILNENNLMAFRQVKILEMSEKNQKTRLTWCQKKKYWSPNQWNRIIFTDESQIHAQKFQIQWVRRARAEILADNYSDIKSKYFAEKKFMVWGAISYDGPVCLYFHEGTVDTEAYKNVLNSCVLDVAGLFDGTLCFQQDNAKCHQSLLKQNYFQDQGINDIIEWPAQSPDLSPIENVWAFVKDMVWKNQHNIEDVGSLITYIEQIWWNNPQLNEIIKNCYDSLPQRIEKVIQFKGNSCRY